MVIKTVDVSYGGENGFNQAIELSAETLGSVKLVQEKRLLQVHKHTHVCMCVLLCVCCCVCCCMCV